MNADLNLINWLMQESGLSKYSISKATGIHQTTLANLEDGTSLIENLSFKNAAALTEYAELKIKEENKMKTWERKGYTVEERDFDYDLHKFVVVVDDEDAAEIVPDTVENMQDVISQLDAGEDAIGWENGNGETVSLPQYIVESEDPEKIKRGGFGIVECFRSYSRKEAEKLYNGIYDKGMTVMLSKLDHGEMELIKERVEE